MKEQVKNVEKFLIEVNAIKNNVEIDLTHPLCKSHLFQVKDPSSFSLFVLGRKVFENKGYKWDEILEEIKNYDNDETFYSNLLQTEFNYLIKDLTKTARENLIKLNQDAYTFLKEEAIEISEKVDRMIEYAFVTCYENKDGEVFLLKDDEGELIYFHEFIYPNEDKTLDEAKVIEKMPLIPYIIHKTDFEFLKGEANHPFLNIKLPRPAPTSEPVLKLLIDLFDYKGDAKEKEIISENIMMFFHNGNGFDVPFIDAEMNKFFEGKKLRDYVQTYDTLKIAKAMIPSDVQKFIASCQSNKNFGGDEKIKSIISDAIMPTSKSLDNVKRLASFLINFDPMKPKEIYKKAQAHFFKAFKDFFDGEEKDWKKYENMLEYSNNENPDISLIKGFPKPKKTEPIYTNLMGRYEKYLEGRKEYVQALNKVKNFEEIYKNIENIKSNIENNEFLKDSLHRLNNIDRSVHGARVDSQLFMETFIVLENAFYIKPKMSDNKRSGNTDLVEISDEIINKMKKLKEGTK